MDIFQGFDLSQILGSWRGVVMVLVAFGLLYLAIKKNFEPLLLVPIGTAMVLANLFPALVAPPHPETGEAAGLFWMLQTYGLKNELFPLLMFLGLGAMMDFTAMMQRPILILGGAAAQIGIFGTLIGALFIVRFLAGDAADPVRVAGAISIIGSADGPSTIYVATKLLSGMGERIEGLLGPITISAYTYMAMVPLIQPPIMRLLTTRKEREIMMEYTEQTISPAVRIGFPIVIMLLTFVVAPEAGPLMGMLALGNILRESGVVDRLSQAAQNEIVNVVTLFLGLAVGSLMTAEAFLQPLTIAVFTLGLVCFMVATAGGVMMGKALCFFSGGKINPLVGAAGLSAMPMAARVVAREAQKARPDNYLLPHALSTNIAGQVGSALAAGALLTAFRVAGA